MDSFPAIWICLVDLWFVDLFMTFASWPFASGPLFVDICFMDQAIFTLINNLSVKSLFFGVCTARYHKTIVAVHSLAHCSKTIKTAHRRLKVPLQAQQQSRLNLPLKVPLKVPLQAQQQANSKPTQSATESPTTASPTSASWLLW